MSRIALAVVFMLASPADAAALCHHYSRWFYPWPQRCAVGLTYKSSPQLRREARAKPIFPPPPDDRPFPLPWLSAAELIGGEADDATRGRLMLHALLGRPAHADEIERPAR
jgi:hypothetical protein